MDYAQDLIERLRLGDGTSPDHRLLLEAADEIERLREALREISKLTWYDEMLGPKIARAALKEKE